MKEKRIEREVEELTEMCYKTIKKLEKEISSIDLSKDKIKSIEEIIDESYNFIKNKKEYWAGISALIITKTIMEADILSGKLDPEKVIAISIFKAILNYAEATILPLAIYTMKDRVIPVMTGNKVKVKEARKAKLENKLEKTKRIKEDLELYSLLMEYSDECNYEEVESKVKEHRKELKR